MISFVTHNMATGTSETHRRKTRLDTTIPGAACHTMRNTGGIFRNAFNRACHFGLGGCSEFGMSGLIQVSFAATSSSHTTDGGATFLSTRSASAYVMVALRHWGQLRGNC